MNKEQHLRSLKIIEAFMDRKDKLSFEEKDYFNRVLDEVEAYESIVYPMPPPSRIDLERFREEQMSGKEK